MMILVEWRVLIVVIVAGCVQSGTVLCPGPDHKRCPEGTTCVAVTPDTLCIPNDDLDDCNDLGELDDCGAGRRCYAALDRLVCLASGCGNRFVDPGERCDDGGNVSDDGCSADCRSNETCGNGVVDPVHGEQCDDSDIITHDGCSSLCRPEQPAWIDRRSEQPNGGRLHGMAYDTKRGRLVVFGGEQPPGPASIGETWEWDGAAWTHVRVPIAPSPRSNPAMAYEGSRGVVVMFGGAMFADTWEWNGAVWTQSDAVGPSRRSSPEMVYDSARKVIVMHGGFDGMSTLGDTWEYRDAQWTQRTTPMNPQLDNQAMAYDPARDVIVLVGTSMGGTNQTWELDATDWHLRATSPAGSNQTLAFDPLSRRIVLLGLETAGAAQLKTWAWDGQTWAALAGSEPPRRNRPQIVTDPVHSRLILFGGSVSNLVFTRDVWERDATGWKINPYSQAFQLAGVPNPGGDWLVGTAVTADPGRGHALLFGGSPDGFGETWSYDGATWARLSTVGPGSRIDHGLAFDIANDRAVLFGGVLASSNAMSAETWLWNGATRMWSPSTTTPAPPARRDPAMAYDARRKRVVMFGGATTNTTPEARVPVPTAVLDDTWEWDGTAWTAIASPMSPEPRTGAALAYDPLRERIVLFGGQSSGIAGDTWTYDGAWHQEGPLSSPGGRAWAAMAWDAGRARLVLVGGAYTQIVDNFEVNHTFDDAWEWDGIIWRAVPIAVPISKRFDHVAFMSPRATGINVLGGRVDDPSMVADRQANTFELKWSANDTVETCGTRLDADRDGATGCADQDCWPRCRPLCAPGVVGCDPLAPGCGDGTCSALESRSICPEDCGVPAAVCGDLLCDPGEDCVGDCTP